MNTKKLTLGELRKWTQYLPDEYVLNMYLESTMEKLDAQINRGSKCLDFIVFDKKGEGNE